MSISFTQMRSRNNSGITQFIVILKIKLHTVSVTDILTCENSRFSSLFAAEERETSSGAKSEEKWLRRLTCLNSTALSLFRKFKQFKPGKANKQTNKEQNHEWISCLLVCKTQKSVIRNIMAILPMLFLM